MKSALRTSISGLTHFPDVRLRDRFGLLEQISRRRGRQGITTPSTAPSAACGVVSRELRARVPRRG